MEVPSTTVNQFLSTRRMILTEGWLKVSTSMREHCCVWRQLALLGSTLTLARVELMINIKEDANKLPLSIFESLRDVLWFKSCRMYLAFPFVTVHSGWSYTL